ncbi:MAG TPA: hypothetical protein VJ203_15670 [Bacteroidales bacterium]|nr:hypothetical protein [Bacteroidales bacterium]
MLKIFFIVVVIVALSLMMLGLNIFFLRRKFPDTEVGKNKDMIRLGLRCPQCEERKNYRRTLKPAGINLKKLYPDWSSLAR